MTKPTRTGAGWVVRLRVGRGQRLALKMPDLPEDVAYARAVRLERMRELLRGKASDRDTETILTDAAAFAADADFAEAECVAEDLASGAPIDVQPATPRSFADVSRLWTTGELRRMYPHRVADKKARTVAKDKARLDKLSKTIGSIPLSRLTEADCDRAIAELPPLADSTRAKYAQLLDYVLRLAVSPLKLIKASPLPPGWVPSGGERAEFQMLYPDEEADLMRCTIPSIGRRALWGFLAREGCRPHEGADLTYGNLDLERGLIRIDRTKTGRPRRWRLGDDVVRTLLALRPEGWKPSDKVFDLGAAPQRMAELLRLDLYECGIVRSELHRTVPMSRRLRAHDLRGTFVALSLARGKSDQWIMDRTGHTQSQMLRAYDRDSRHAAEQELGWFEPLDVLLGVAKSAPTTPQKGPENQWPSESNADFQGDGASASRRDDAGSSERVETKTHLAHPGAEGGRESWPGGKEHPKGAEGRHGAPEAGQPSAPTDPHALAVADLALSIRLAAQAGEWAFAARLEAKLDRLTATASGVASLDQHRARKGTER